MSLKIIMINRNEAVKFLKEKNIPPNIIKHMLCTEALMGGVYDALMAKGITDLDGTKEEWMLAGLLHDGDYIAEVPVEKQGIQITQWLREKGYEIPENTAHAMAAHNWVNSKVEPKNLIDWAIFCGDSLTGLIVACALIMPSKKLADVTVESVLKKFKNKAFAAGTRRDDIQKCEEKLNLPLTEFIQTALSSMQEISSDLGL